MRKFYFSWAVVLMLGTGSGWCQPVSPFILNASGGSAQLGNLDFYVDWNVAEMALVNTMKAPPGPKGIYVITNGLLQNRKQFAEAAARIMPDSSALLPAGSVRVFPNPAAQYLEVQFFLGEPGKVRLLLYDINGIQVYGKEITVGSKGYAEQIPLNHLASGTYYLRVLQNSPAGQPTRQTGYKIVKL